jgi:hypothetical protein
LICDEYFLQAIGDRPLRCGFTSPNGVGFLYYLCVSRVYLSVRVDRKVPKERHKAVEGLESVRSRTDCFASFPLLDLPLPILQAFLQNDLSQHQGKVILILSAHNVPMM